LDVEKAMDAEKGEGKRLRGNTHPNLSKKHCNAEDLKDVALGQALIGARIKPPSDRRTNKTHPREAEISPTSLNHHSGKIVIYTPLRCVTRATAD
jgi:hypothetical protein